MRPLDFQLLYLWNDETFGGSARTDFWSPFWFLSSAVCVFVFLRTWDSSMSFESRKSIWNEQRLVEMKRFTTEMNLTSSKTTAVFQIWWTMPYLEQAGLPNKMADVFDASRPASLDITGKKVLWLAFPYRKQTNNFILSLFKSNANVGSSNQLSILLTNHSDILPACS